MPANQARRRDSLSPSSKQYNSLTDLGEFCYHSLDTEVDCTRLVKIHPARNEDDPLTCDLIHVTFGARPKFEALSYRWGENDDPKTILVDGMKFRVGRNLWDALHFLRGRAENTPYWIDALCINQRDTEERNRQLRIMGHIYFRASTVVVWLGRRYLRFQSDIEESQLVRGPTITKAEPSRPSADKDGQAHDAVSGEGSSEREMVRELCADGYWNRLWIIQEIVQARQIKVCFGKLAMTWAHFTHLVTMHNSDGGGPLRLDRHRKERYNGSHTFRKLLEDHEAAECKEPRDKIYGLVGLAADARGFTMDYNKSLIEIWTDTMEFMNWRGLLPESELVEFGKLVKRLLMGTQCGPLQQALRPYQPEKDSALVIEDHGDSRNPKVFQQSAFVLGCVSRVGPSTTETIASLQKVDEWAGEVQVAFRDELGNAHRESNTLIGAILELDEATLETMCSSHTSTVRWRGNLARCFHGPILEGGPYETKPDHYGMMYNHTRKLTTHQADRNTHLYLIKNPWGGTTQWKMGIASSQIQQGDLICWIKGIPKAVAIRVHEMNWLAYNSWYDVKMQIIGTALVTEDVAGVQEGHSRRLGSFGNDKVLPIKMDARTLFVLLA
ncbi:hypothetical protein DL766_009785 [Monosporascus sp. MC13-8B]|nr:hypothetical protein DL763_002722 [Monosporascus cannonballus]RYP13951.1 hypothetical protein DL766_009785 [Monosporascus sp. MC13-8B]